MSKEDSLNDLVEKYATYNNLGLKRTIIGFILFVTLLFMGFYIY